MKALGGQEMMRRLAVHAGAHGVEIDVTTNEERRAAVLRHPDLVERLREKPMALEDPAKWSGYIAPEHLETGARNNSPYRAQAAAIYAEALRREAGAR